MIQKTRCPHCQRAFRVSLSQLEAARGMVRCGVCFQSFNAGLNLEGAAEVAGDNDRNSRHWKDEDDFYIDDNFDLSRLEEKPDNSPKHEQRKPSNAATPTNAETPEQETTPFDTNLFTPGFEEINSELDVLAVNDETMAQWQPGAESVIDEEGEQPGDTTSSHRQWPWVLGSIAALALLFIQLIYFNSERIEPVSPLRGASELVCGWLHCPLSEERDIRKIDTRDLVIRSHPSVSSALLIDAVLVNTASFSQPYPSLRLRFEDLQGTTVAARIFSPGEYLRETVTDNGKMGPNQPVKVELEIVDPGETAVSYRLDLVE